MPVASPRRVRILLACLLAIAACGDGPAVCGPGGTGVGTNAGDCPCRPSRDACDAPPQLVCSYVGSASTYSCVGGRWTPSGDVDAGAGTPCGVRTCAAGLLCCPGVCGGADDCDSLCSPPQGGSCDLGAD